MRMIVDLSDFDASVWNHLTGTSGHTFHPNYVDQTENLAERRAHPVGLLTRGGGGIRHRHARTDVRPDLDSQPPAAGGVRCESASSSTSSAFSLIVPLR